MGESSAPDMPETGAHRLGPHVVGQRVVVRRLLRGETGPTGGPAFTDLLGVCTAWQDGWCEVQPESGAPVRIALADIVSGKPVPPRPPVRHRVSPADAQARAAAMFPDLAGEPADDGDVVFLLAGVARALRAARSVVERRPVVELAETHPVVELAETPAADHPTVTATLLTVDGQPAATGVAAYADDWLGLRDVEVDPAHRRRGLGTAVLAGLLEWGAEQGATTAYLQVPADDAAALAMCERLGFAEHHRFRHRAPDGR